MRITLPPPLTDSPPDAYLVGGAVRDLIQGRRPTDFDIAVLSDPGPFARRLVAKAGGRWVRIGKNQLCVHRLICPQHTIDVSAVKGRNIFSDLLERDFTINALACDLSYGGILDCTGGLNDLNRHMIRMVCPANMLQDPIRMLRAYRMAAGLQFQIEKHTLSMIKSNADQIKAMPGERVWAELRLILASDNSRPQIVAMAESGLLQALLPELASLMECRQNEHHAGDVWSHTLEAYAALEKLLSNPLEFLPPQEAAFVQSMTEASRILIKLSILLHDIGKPQSRTLHAKGKIRFINHADRGARLARRICQRLRMSNSQSDWITFMVCHHQRPLTLFLCHSAPSHASTSALGRFFRICAGQTPYLLLLAMADTQGKVPGVGPGRETMIRFFKSTLRDYLSRIRPMADQTPLLNGKDLIEGFHLQPSPALGDLLNRVHEAQLSGIINDRRQARQWVSDFLAQRSYNPDRV